MYNPQGCQAASRQGQTRGRKGKGSSGQEGSWLVILYYFLMFKKKNNVTFLCFS